MTTSLAVAAAIDAAAMLLLICGLYWPRHGRHDAAIGATALNAAIFTLTVTLHQVEVTAAAGLALFGALSLIRLRSAEISHRQLAYYCTALALGLATGLSPTPTQAAGLAAGLLLALALIDSPRINPTTATSTIILDGIHPTQREAMEALRALGHPTPVKVRVTKIDAPHRTTQVKIHTPTPPTRTLTRQAVGHASSLPEPTGSAGSTGSTGSTGCTEPQHIRPAHRAATPESASPAPAPQPA